MALVLTTEYENGRTHVDFLLPEDNPVRVRVNHEPSHAF